MKIRFDFHSFVIGQSVLAKIDFVDLYTSNAVKQYETTNRGQSM